MRAFAEYSVASVNNAKRIVWIVDHDGGCSVTNAAEGVCRTLNLRYPGYRIIYRDTDGNWDELAHVDGVFAGYKPARDMGIFP